MCEEKQKSAHTVSPVLGYRNCLGVGSWKTSIENERFIEPCERSCQTFKLSMLD